MIPLSPIPMPKPSNGYTRVHPSGACDWLTRHLFERETIQETQERHERSEAEAYAEQWKVAA